MSTRTNDLDETKLKSMFDKTSDSTSIPNGNKQFQFQFFQDQEPIIVPTPKMFSTPRPILNGKSRMFSNKPDHTAGGEDDTTRPSRSDQIEINDQTTNETFFFFDIDQRLKDGLESFVRTEDFNELERTWPTKRKQIGEALRTKHRKAIQRKDKHRVFNHRHRQRQQTSSNLVSKSDHD